MDRIIIQDMGIIPFNGTEDLLDYVQHNTGILVAVNAEKILKADDSLRALTRKHIGYCDGVGAVLVLRKYGYKGVSRIPGVELWLDIIRRFQTTKSFYFIGSTKETINATIESLNNDFPGINILGFRDGYFQGEERSQVIDDVVNKRPDFVFVAMGSPRQEDLMTDMYSRHPVVYQGLGGSFDVYSGKIKRAPKIFRSMGLEWLYRLIRQPSRFRRYLPLFKFFCYVVSSKK